MEAQTPAELPAERFEIRSYSQVMVLQNGHVHLKEDLHYSSVPYRYIRKKVRIAYTSKQVKIFYKYDCIAIHKRTKSRYNYTTDSDHLASTHQQYTKWNAEFFLKWAAFKSVVEDNGAPGLSADQLVGHLVDAEYDDRYNRKILRLLKTARLRYKAAIEEIRYEEGRNLDREMIIRLADGIYLDKAENLFITGSTGVGKSYLACPFGH